MEYDSEYEMWLRRRGLSSKTIEQRVRFCRLASREIGDLATVSAVDVLGWLTGFDGWTRRGYEAGLRSVFDFLTRTGRRSDHPLRGDDVKRAPTPDLNPKPLSPAEEAAVLLTAQGDLFAYLLLGFRMGFRAHEIAKIHGHDVTQRLTHVVGKGSKSAYIPTHPDVWELAQAYPRDGYWFPSKYKRRDYVSAQRVGVVVGRHFTQHGIEGSIHRTRATFGTTLARNGTPLHVVQKLMRHSSLSSTQHYLGTDQDEMAAAIAGLGRHAA